MKESNQAPKKRRGDVELVDPIIKPIGFVEPDGTDNRKWIVANRYDGKKLKGPFDSEGAAFAAMKGKGSAKAD